MKRWITHLAALRAPRTCAGLAVAAAVLFTVARLLPIEITTAHTGRLATTWAFSEDGTLGGFDSSHEHDPEAPGDSRPESRQYVGVPGQLEPPFNDEVDLAEFTTDSPPTAHRLDGEPHRVGSQAHGRSGEPSGIPSGAILGRAAVDLEGRVWRIGESAGCRALSLVFLSPDCPISNGSIPELNRLAAEFADHGVQWFGIVADAGLTRGRAAEHYRAYDLSFPVLFDAAGEWREALQPTHVPQCFVLSPDGRVQYTGRIDDRHVALNRRKPAAERRYLSDALADLLADRTIAIPETEPIGCLVEERSLDGDSGVTWCREVAPIVFAHCAGCHRSGEVGPFPLTHYEEVSRRGRQVALVAAERIMPPWQPEPGFGHFHGERRLSDREIDLLARWAEAGAPFGNREDLPPVPEFTPGWQLGTPDLVVELPVEFEVPADGNDIYQYFVLPTDLTQDRAITAIEFRPTSPQVVHHASFCYDTSGAGRRLDAADPGPGYRRFGGAGFTPDGSLGGWAPGVTPRHLPDGLGRTIKRGADVVVQVHYHPIGRPVRDRSRIGIHFADGPVRQRMGELLVANMNLRIPAGTGRFVHRASYTLPVDVTVHAVAPHMHLLGREITARAELPDGRTQPLVRVSDWDFNWQDVYFYAQPLSLPAGTRIELECVYDNSASNPFNPSSPPRDVQWGERSIDEMGICYFDVTTRRPADLASLIADNQAEISRQLGEHPWLLEPPPEFRESGR